MSVFALYEQQLQQLKIKGQYRTFPCIQHQQQWIVKDGLTMLNCASNDYLGLASDTQLQQQFQRVYALNDHPLTSASSRLLTGHFPIYDDLEQLLAQRFKREAALLFNSGYHANIGILPALADKQTLILADKLVHASMIDGIRLAGCQFYRYRHNDYAHLVELLTRYHDQYQRIIIVTESVFSMDGDIADIAFLVRLKQQYSNVLLYVDEAHAVGVMGQTGLGLIEQQGFLSQVDFIVGTFGKAIASMGAYLVCDQLIKDYLINTMRPLIFSTALPPYNIAWSYFIIEQLPSFSEKRQKVHQLSQKLQSAVRDLQQSEMLSTTHIVPYIIGDNSETVKRATQLQQRGFYCLPIRPPTVPNNTARIRFSLTAAMKEMQIDQLIQLLQEYHH